MKPHLADEWGVSFQTAYDLICTVRARLHERTAYLALSVSVEKDRQTENIIRIIGFRRGEFHFEKRDCERRNVDIIIREIAYNRSWYDFRDLDWLIPVGLMKPSDVAKILLYCETIELGHRIVIFSVAVNVLPYGRSQECWDPRSKWVSRLAKLLVDYLIAQTRTAHASRHNSSLEERAGLLIVIVCRNSSMFIRQLNHIDSIVEWHPAELNGPLNLPPRMLSLQTKFKVYCGTNNAFPAPHNN